MEARWLLTHLPSTQKKFAVTSPDHAVAAWELLAAAEKRSADSDLERPRFPNPLKRVLFRLMREIHRKN